MEQKKTSLVIPSQKVNSLIQQVQQTGGRIIVVANRLPLSAKRDPKSGTYTFTMSSGGLVSGLEGVKKSFNFIWIGSTGTNIPEEDKEAYSKQLWEQKMCVPVFLPEKLADDHYNGFSNSVLWPLFHYMLDQPYQEEWWHGYQKVNQIFADVVLKTYKPGDLLWIHDYHLCTMPYFLRKRSPNIRQGFFLHIPFPSSEIFQTVPAREELLRGMLSCDMIGFHTYDYARHFISSCGVILGLETTPTGVYFEGRFVPADTLPIGIDPEKFVTTMKDPEVLQQIKEHRARWQGKKILLGVDRLDYIKGIPHKLEALNMFFEKHPDWQDKIVLVQIAVPSRTDVEEYKRLKQEVDHLVGQINSSYGRIDFNPVHYLFTSVDFKSLVALYAVTDVMMITSVRDGMNLVASEFIACQAENHGNLILSEFAGCASALGTGSLIVNPWNTHEVANAIYEAVKMEETAKQQRWEKCWSFVSTRTAASWGQSFVRSLVEASSHAVKLASKPRLNSQDLRPAFQKAPRRVVFISEDHLRFSTKKLVATGLQPVKTSISDLLSALKNTQVFLVSSKGKDDVEKLWGVLPITLVAESGYTTSPPPASTEARKWDRKIPNLDLSFKESARLVCNYYQKGTPGSVLFEQESGFTLDFSRCDSHVTKRRISAFRSDLQNSQVPIGVFVTENSVTARPYECNLISQLSEVLSALAPEDFFLYLGELPPIPAHLLQGRQQNLSVVCDIGMHTPSSSSYLPNSEALADLFNDLAKAD